MLRRNVTGSAGPSRTSGDVLEASSALSIADEEPGTGNTLHGETNASEPVITPQCSILWTVMNRVTSFNVSAFLQGQQRGRNLGCCCYPVATGRCYVTRPTRTPRLLLGRAALATIQPFSSTRYTAWLFSNLAKCFVGKSTLPDLPCFELEDDHCQSEMLVMIF